MPTDTQVPADLHGALRRYQEIQREEQRLKEEKAILQEKLSGHMATAGQPFWFPEVDGVALRVSYKEETLVEYDEEVLRQRLGSRYVSILQPDPRKIRHAMERVAPLLEPILEEVGSPVPERVRTAIAAGTVTKEEFKGTFTKTVRRRIAVSRARPQGAGAGPAPASAQEPDEA